MSVSLGNVANPAVLRRQPEHGSLTLMIYGKMTPKEALTDLAKKVDDQLGQFKASHPNW